MEVSKHKIESLWKAIENELLRQKVGRRIEEMLLPPATKIDVARFEEIIGVSLPSEYILSLGTHEGTVYWVWLWDAVDLPCISEVIEAWKTHIDLASHPNGRGAELRSQGPVQRCMFDPLWVPFASDNGIPICFDLNPLPGGIVGQVIYVDWEDGTVRVIANSFVDFLENGLKKMRAS